MVHYDALSDLTPLCCPLKVPATETGKTLGEKKQNMAKHPEKLQQPLLDLVFSKHR